MRGMHPFGDLSRRLALAALAAGLVCCGATAAADGQQRIIEKLGGVVDLAIAPNDQTIYAAIATTGEILAFERDRPEQAWIAVRGGGRPLAVVCIDSSTLAVLRATEEGSVLTTHRLAAPPEAVDGSAAEQRLPLPTVSDGSDAAAAPRVVVSPGREWLAVAGLPPAGSGVVRVSIARRRLLPRGRRHGPQLPAGRRIVAAAISPADELVLATSTASSAERVSFHAELGGRMLLELDPRLSRIRDACYASEVGGLWVAADAPADRSRQGIWRIDATVEEGRQAIRPVLVAGLEAVTAIASTKDGCLYAAADDGSSIVRIDPEQALAAEGVVEEN